MDRKITVSCNIMTFSCASEKKLKKFLFNKLGKFWLAYTAIQLKSLTQMNETQNLDNSSFVSFDK